MKRKVTNLLRRGSNTQPQTASTPDRMSLMPIPDSSFMLAVRQAGPRAPQSPGHALAPRPTR
eukprot:512597-Prymnesium_polylepis.1